MGKALSLDLRRHVAAAVVGGEPVRSGEARFQVFVARAVRLGHKLRAGTDLTPAKRGGPRPSPITVAGDDGLRARLVEEPDLTMRALAGELDHQGTSVTHDTGVALCAPAGPDAQNKTLMATERERPAIARFRHRWRAHQHRIDPDRLVFLDETWIRTDMTRLRGWCPRSVPLLAKVLHSRWRTLTFVAGLRRTEIVAPCVFDGPINVDLFTAWVKQSLVPGLKPRDVVVLDTLGS